MKQIITLFALLVGMMFLVSWLNKPGNTNKIFSQVQLGSTPNPTQDNRKFVKIGANTFKVEIARTPEERKRGLAGHEPLDADSGMLFVFEKQNVQPPFWMKGMTFPIDIIWIDNNKVVQITSDIPTIPTDLPDENIPQYKPTRPVDYVLEVAAKTAEKKGIKVGDSVELPQL